MCVFFSMSFMSDFDVMLARKKAQGGKRRRNRDGGTFISDADDVVSAMITKMTEAAEVCVVTCLNLYIDSTFNHSRNV